MVNEQLVNDLVKKIHGANLTDSDYHDLFFQLIGACSVSNQTPWKTIENIVVSYVNEKKEKNEKHLIAAIFGEDYKS